MNEKSLFQKICTVAFLVFAIISCVTTAQSLSLTLEMGIPYWISFAMMFIFAFGIYLLTSYCFKLVIDACNMDVYVDHRRRDFVLGIFGVLLFWLVCSMPTNTHSLFYIKVIDKVVIAELDNQKETLNTELQLLGMDINAQKDKEIELLKSEVATLRDRFITEINHTDRPGLGVEAFNILKDIEVKCGVNPDSYFLHTTQRNTSGSERERIKKHYIPQINNLLKQKIDEINAVREREIAYNAEKKNLLSNYITKIEQVKDYQRNLDVPHQDRIKAARSVLDNAYNNPDYRDKILNNVEVLVDANAGHKDNNVESYKIYKTERLHSVFKLWGDYLSGKMQNLDFDMFYWVIISLIIDIAGLLFFAIAFRKTY